MIGRSSPAQRQAGFTLVELLVVIVLLGMISVALFGGIRFGARSWEAGHETLEQISEIEVAQSLLRRLLGTARGVTLFDAGSRRNAVSFTGRPDAVYFAAPLPAHRGFGGAYGFSLSVQRGPRGDDLVLAWRLQRPDAAPSDDGDFEDRTVLLSNVADVSFTYYGALERDRLQDWRDSWVDADGLPQLVRLTVEFGPDDGRHWPPLTVTPMLSTAAAGRTR